MALPNTLLGSMVHANRDEISLCRRHSRQLYTVASMRSCPGVPCVTTSCSEARPVEIERSRHLSKMI